MPRVAIRRVLLAAAALALAATGASGGAVASAATAAPAISTGFTALGALDGVSATSPSNAWAVGATTKGTKYSGPLTVHWNGRGWTKVPAPGPATATLNAVDALSATSAWAVGDTTTTAESKPFIIHWNGKAWKQIAAPSLTGAYLSSVSATSPSNAWAVGTDPKGALILHWNGKAWKQFAAPKPKVGIPGLFGVSAASASVAWAVGALSGPAGPSRDLILRWNGKAWSVVSGAPAEAYSELTGVAATSARNAWLVGCPCTGGPSGIVTSRWNGKSWANLPVPVKSPFGAGGEIAAVGGLAWAAGWYCKAHCGGSAVIAPLLMLWTGKKWQVIANPLPRTAFVEGLAVTSASNAWAVGSIESSTTVTKTFILHWNGKTWK